MSVEAEEVSADGFNRAPHHGALATCSKCSLPFPLLLFFLFALGENLVVLIFPACIVREAQTLAEYNGDPFVSSLVIFLTSVS